MQNEKQRDLVATALKKQLCGLAAELFVKAFKGKVPTEQQILSKIGEVYLVFEKWFESFEDSELCDLYYFVLEKKSYTEILTDSNERLIYKSFLFDKLCRILKDEQVQKDFRSLFESGLFHVLSILEQLEREQNARTY